MPTTLRRLTAACSLLTFLLLPALTRAETGVPAWVQRYDGPGSGNDYAYALAVDRSNNVVVAGYSPGSGSGNDYATIKYSSAGVPLWTNRYNGPGNGDDEAWDLAVDASNNVVVTGWSVGSAGNLDYATIKYSSAGLPLWTNRYNGPGNGDDYAVALAVDGNNNVVVTGLSPGSAGDSDYATIEYSSTGLPLWTNRYNGPGNDYDYATAVAVDGNNNVIVTGYSPGNGSAGDYATIKYSSAGLPLWTNRYNGPGNGDDYARALAVDGSNNVIVTGYATGSSGAYHYATIKYSSAGLPLWTNGYNGPGNSSDIAQAVAVDGSNNVIVTGASTGSGSTYDYTMVKYSSAGVPLWTNRYNGPGNSDDKPTAVAVDGSNNVFVTGYSIGSGSAYDYATIKYSSAGVPLWTSRYNGLGNGDDYARALAVDRSGNAFVTGSSTGSASNYDFATIKYVSVPSPVMSGIQRTNGTLRLCVNNLLQPGTLVIEASTNLAAWSSVFTNTAPTNVLFYTDPDAGNHPRRFYRAFQSP